MVNQDTKQVNYAYPTSIHANKYNNGNGVWLVEFGPGAFIPLVIEGTPYSTEREAVDAAYALDMPWAKCWLSCQQHRLEYETPSCA